MILNFRRSIQERRRRGRWLRDFWTLAKPYWVSEERKIAAILLFSILSLAGLVVYFSVVLNAWYKKFWDSAQNADGPLFFRMLFTYIAIALVWVFADSVKSYLMMSLQIRWRRWMTRRMLDSWMDGHQHHMTNLLKQGADNPDQRISEDISLFVRETLDLSLGLFSQILTLGSFTVVLWNLSGVLNIPIWHGHSLAIPGYLIYASLIYAGVCSMLSHKIGKRLTSMDVDQQRKEADFRYALVRVRENSESIASMNGETTEMASFAKLFSAIVDNFHLIMRKKTEVGFFSAVHGQFSFMIPMIAAAPKLLSKQIQVGGFMQIGSAFGSVEGALSFIVKSYSDLAHWRSVVERLSGFGESIGRSRRILDKIKIGTRSDEYLSTHNLTLFLPDGKPLLVVPPIEFKEGETILISGPTGSGKSTLLRTLVNLWPFATGSFSMPSHGKVFFLPQKAYLPTGTLRSALLYPGGVSVSDQELHDVLYASLLAHLSGRLDDEENWAQILSGGEQQRLGFARIFLQKPKWIFLDEATSALDEASQAIMYDELVRRFPHACIVSVGHRTSLAAFHNRELRLGDQPKSHLAG